MDEEEVVWPFHAKYWENLLRTADRGRPPVIYMLHKLHKKHCKECQSSQMGQLDCLMGFFIDRDPFDDLMVPEACLRNVCVRLPEPR
jgi:hypothetical protein